MRPRTMDCAWAEKPKPPCSLEMSMPRKPCFLTKSQISAGTSLSLCRMVQSLTIRQSSLVGPSRKAFSSSVRVMGGTERSLSQSGWPENSSASKPMVPAFRASCSVAEILGRMPLSMRNSGWMRTGRLTEGALKAARMPTSTHGRMARVPGAAAPNWPRTSPDCQRSSATARPTAHIHSGARRMARMKAPMMQRTISTSSGMATLSLRARIAPLHHANSIC